MSENNNYETFDWDDEILDDGEQRDFIVLEPGEYEFEVYNFERAFYTAKADGKLPDCNEADITLKISTDEGDAFVKDKFYLVKACEWKISSFFVSIGLKKHGEPLRMDWNGSIGLTGRCKVTKDKGTKNDEVYFNNVKSYVAPKAKAAGEEDTPW